MKKFGLKIIIFLLLIVVLDFCVGSLCKHLYFNARGGNIERENHISEKMLDDMIVLGSSRASHHYIPQQFADSLDMSCYNCGQDGNGIIFAYGKWQTIKRRYYPKVILYEITSGFDILKNDNTKYIERLRPYYHLDGVKTLICDIDANERWKMQSRCYPYNSRIFNLLMDNISAKKDKTIDGYAPLYGKMDYTPPVEQTAFDPDNIDTVKLKYFEKFITEAKDHCLLIACISPQFGQNNSSIFTPAIDLCKKYGIPVLDHYADPAFSGRPDLFKDQVHLNSDGAAVYTGMVAREVWTMMARLPVVK